MRFMFSASAPNSSRLGMLTVTPKLPAATWLRNSCASRTGRMNDHEITNPKSIASTDREDGEARHHEAERRLAASACAEPRHARLLRATTCRTCPSIFRYSGSSRVVERVHGVVDLALADEVRDVRDHRHRVVLRRPDLLDQRALVGRRRRLDAGERVVEAVVLAKDLRDRRFVLEHERHRRVVHLQRERVLDLL